MTPHTTTAEVDSADELLAIAKTIPDRHVQTALTNVRAHLAVLRGRVERAQQRQREKARLDAERAEAKRRVEQLQAQLAATRAQLRRLGAGAGLPSIYDPSAVRAWARQHGYYVADRGRIPIPVLEAYESAHAAPSNQ